MGKLQVTQSLLGDYVTAIGVAVFNHKLHTDGQPCESIIPGK